GDDRSALGPRGGAGRRPQPGRRQLRGHRQRRAGAGSLHGAAPMGLLSVEAVVAGYGPAEEILKGVNLEVAAGQIVSIVGPNGAGKSTLLKTIAGLLTPSRGSIRFEDKPIAGLAPG